MPCAVRHLYQGALFKKSVLWCLARRIPWRVLSAQHGLLAPDDLVVPYNLALGDLDRAARDAWGVQVAADLRALGVTELVHLAGVLYQAYVPHLTGVRIAYPMQGLPLGRRLAWLAQG